MNQLLHLQDKLRQLLRAFADLKAENERLQKKVDRLAEELEQKTQERQELSQNLQMASLKNLHSEMTQEERERLKRQLDEAIATLDKNIQLLR